MVKKNLLTYLSAGMILMSISGCNLYELPVNKNDPRLQGNLPGSLTRPSFEPDGGMFQSAPSVTLNGILGSSICYTVDGSNPSVSDPGVCSNGIQTFAGDFISLPGSGVFVIRAVSTQEGYQTSEIAISNSFRIDNSAPTPGTLTSVGTTQNTITLAWTPAADNLDLPAELQFKIVKDAISAANIDTLAEANSKSGADLVLDWTSGLDQYLVSGLSPNSLNHFALLVRDQLGNESIYPTLSVSTNDVPGAIDLSFGSAGGADNDIYSVVSQADGKIIIGGSFGSYSATTRQGIARLELNGNLDSGFNSSSGAFDTDFSEPGTVFSIAIQPDNKILIAGSFKEYGGVSRPYIARVNNNGSLDTAFSTGTGPNDWVYAVVLQADGRILIAGDFSTVAGITRQRVARLNADGSLDTTFDSSSGFNSGSSVYTMQQRTDGKIILGGTFTTYKSVNRQRIVRINSDASLDTAFDSSAGPNAAVRSISLLPDNDVYIGGDFLMYGGSTRQGIARVNPDGSLDSGFNSASGFTASVRGLFSATDGSVYAVGNFTNYGGTARNRIAKIQPNGTLDSAFNPGSGADVWVYAISQDSSGRLLIGGDFTTYNGSVRNRIARIWP